MLIGQCIHRHALMFTNWPASTAPIYVTIWKTYVKSHMKLMFKAMNCVFSIRLKTTEIRRTIIWKDHIIIILYDSAKGRQTIILNYCPALPASLYYIATKNNNFIVVLSKQTSFCEIWNWSKSKGAGWEKVSRANWYSTWCSCFQKSARCGHRGHGDWCGRPGARTHTCFTVENRVKLGEIP